MAPKVPMLLPKGIVLNTNTVYDSIARHEVLPPETMHQCWKIYTTTHRKLHDPTARRLENCWWRIWGSDRRYLKGEIVAGLYRHISTGPTVVPIRGPDNRWEPGRDDADDKENEEDVKNGKESEQNTQNDGNGAMVATPVEDCIQQQQQQQQQEQESPGLSTVVTPPQDPATDASGKPRPTTVRTHSESTHAAPVPLHPILKKDRRSSGKRQVTRFAPTPTDNSSGIESDVSSGSTAATAQTSEPAPAQLQAGPLNPPAPKKKHVTVTPAKRLMGVKKRPVLPRRQSSQSSTGSDAGAGAGAQRLAPVVGSPRASPKPADSSTETLLEDEEEVDEEDEAKLRRSKAAGKKPARSVAPAAAARHPLAKTTLPAKKASEPAVKSAPPAVPKSETVAKSTGPGPSKPSLAKSTTALVSEPEVTLDVPTPMPKATMTSTTLTTPLSKATTSVPSVSTATPTSLTTTASSEATTTSMATTTSSSYVKPTETAPKKLVSKTPPSQPQQNARSHPPLSKTTTGGGAPLMMGRSHSHQGSTGSDHHRPGSRLTALVQPTATTATMSNVSAQGILLDLEGEMMVGGTRMQQQPVQGDLAHRPAQMLPSVTGAAPAMATTAAAAAAAAAAQSAALSEYEKQTPPTSIVAPFTPTPQSRTPQVPLGRTRSHLQILLDKDGGPRRPNSGGDRSKRNSRG